MNAKELISDEGFLKAFYERVRQYQVEGKKRTHVEIYEELEDIFEAEFGCQRFKSYDAFRKKRDRSIKQS